MQAATKVTDRTQRPLRQEKSVNILAFSGQYIALRPSKTPLWRRTRGWVRPLRPCCWTSREWITLTFFGNCDHYSIAARCE